MGSLHRHRTLFSHFQPHHVGWRFDAASAFILRWLLALRPVPDHYLHQPHRWPAARSTGLDYPQPIVDHGKARVRTLEAYEVAKARGGALDEPR